MNKTETLRDGTEVAIRLLKEDDLDKLMIFYRDLPEEDRNYLRIDVTDRDIVEKRLKLMESGQIVRIVALHEGNIIADGAVETFEEKWRKHQTELRLIVAGKHQRKGLGMIILRELYFLALERKAEMLIIRIMRPQVAARNITRKLGFRECVLIPDYLKDLNGVTQDMIIMTCDMNECWKEMENLYHLSDWRKHR